MIKVSGNWFDILNKRVSMCQYHSSLNPPFIRLSITTKSFETYFNLTPGIKIQSTKNLIFCFYLFLIFIFCFIYRWHH